MWVYVAPSSQRQGVGTALVQEVLSLCDNWLMLRRVELTVVVANDGARALYERLGFVVEGRRRDSVISRGRYLDELLMSRLNDGPSEPIRDGGGEIT